jgi:hypothetical protein
MLEISTCEPSSLCVKSRVNVDSLAVAFVGVGFRCVSDLLFVVLVALIFVVGDFCNLFYCW